MPKNQTVQNAKKRKRKRLVQLCILSCFVAVVTVLGVLYIDNRTVDYEFISIGEAADSSNSLRIAHLSDLHFNNMKPDARAIEARLAQESPDMIAITGDIIHDEKGIGSTALYDMVDALVEIAPVYYVEGNHEVRCAEREALYQKLSECGVSVLLDDSAILSVRGFDIEVMGLRNDEDYHADLAQHGGADYRILLAHHPEKFLSYADPKHIVRPNLVLSGHAHGGQFRIFGHGVFVPDQGLFAKYDSGLYQSDDKRVLMVVSRGIGNSDFPFRFNNPPHIPLIDVFLS